MNSGEKRILHVSTGVGLGGAESLLYECAHTGKDRGYQPWIVSLKSGGRYADRLRDAGVPVIELDATANSLNLKAMWSLRRLLGSYRPHIVQAWMYHANLFTLLSCVLGGLSPAKHLLWGIFAAKTDMNSYGRSTASVAGIGAHLSRLPAAIVYNARRAASDHAAMGYHPRQTIIINNGVDTDRFKPDQTLGTITRKALGIDESACVAIIAARNHPQKDWGTALAGVSAVKNLTTLAVGEGTESLADQPGLLRLGAREDMPALYAAADLFLLPSAYGEGTSVAMCEAMATGLPVVVTDVGDNAEVGSKAGFVVQVGNREELTQRLDELVANTALRKVLGTRARNIILDRFSRDAGFSGLFDFYDKLSGSKN